MLIHVTRHAQRLSYVPKPGEDSQYSPDDRGISELGIQQAKWLAGRLVELGFKGQVYSSPYHRAMQTAQTIAAAIGASILPEPAIQEYVPDPGLPPVHGQTLEEIFQRYANVHPAAVMHYPWFFTGPEGRPEVQARVKPFIDKLVSGQQEDVLLVGHGATVMACMRIMLSMGQLVGEVPEQGQPWNCSLSTYEVSADLQTRIHRLFDISHMPADSVTANNEFMVGKA